MVRGNQVAVVPLGREMGATSVALALSRALCLTRQSVLLVDFGVGGAATERLGASEPNSERLPALLKGQSVSDRIGVFVRSAGVGLDILPAFPGLDDLGGGDLVPGVLENVFAGLSKGYGWLVVDCPPEGRELSARCAASSDQTVLVGTRAAFEARTENRDEALSPSGCVHEVVVDDAVAPRRFDEPRFSIHRSGDASGDQRRDQAFSTAVFSRYTREIVALSKELILHVR